MNPERHGPSKEGWMQVERRIAEASGVTAMSLSPGSQSNGDGAALRCGISVLLPPNSSCPLSLSFRSGS